MSATPQLTRTAKTLALLLATFLATEAARSYLSKNATAAALIAAVGAEWACGAMGVAWSDPHADPPTARVVTRRALRGVGIGAAACALTAAVLMLGFGARLSRATPAVGELLITLVVTLMVAVRHELIAHGLLLRALGDAPRSLRMIACAALSYAFVVGTGIGPRDALYAIPLGACTGVLWMCDRGAFAAVGFHATWAFVWAGVLHGALLDLRAPQESPWTGRGSLSMGGVAVIALAVTAAVVARFGPRIFAVTPASLEKRDAARVD